MSLAYLDQESPMKDQDYKRYTVNMNGEIQATEFLKVGMGINASHSIKNYGIVSNFSNTTAKRFLWFGYQFDAICSSF